MKSWLFPSEKNNHKANLLKPLGLVIIYALYLGNYLVLHAIGRFYPGVLGYSSEITQEKVFKQTNQERQKEGLGVLKYNPDLSISAQAKANDMFSKGYWAHTSPDGTSPWDFFKQIDYKYSYAGENLAKDFYDTESLMKAWIKSPTHRENVVNTNYQEIGIGVVNGTLNGYKTTIVVQHFGTPAVGVVTKAVSDFPTQGVASAQTEQTQMQRITSSPINPIMASKTVGTALFMLLVAVLAIDGYNVLKRNTHRISSSSFAHMLFIIIAIVMLFLTQQGSLL